MPKKKSTNNKKIEYFRSNSQRKGVDRASLLFGSKRVMLTAVLLVFASGAVGFGILQKAKDSQAATLFYASYDNGTASPWTGGQCSSSWSCTIVNAPGGRTGKVARYEVRDGDCPVTGGTCYGERAERQGSSVGGLGTSQGDTRWYSWSMYLENGFPISSGWQILSQWHSAGNGPPPVEFNLSERSFKLQINKARYAGDTNPPASFPWSKTISTGQWYDMKMNIYWSQNGDGYVRTWINGQEQPRYSGPTLRPGEGTYFKQGYYRSQGVSGTGIVYYDNTRVAQFESDLDGLGNPAPNPSPGGSIPPAPPTSTPIPVYPGTRDPYKWPFSRYSIWNTPIGTNARYVPANLKNSHFHDDKPGDNLPWDFKSPLGIKLPHGASIDADWEQIGVNPSDPIKTLRVGSNNNAYAYVHVPSDMEHPGKVLKYKTTLSSNWGPWWGYVQPGMNTSGLETRLETNWNGCATFLGRDNTTIYQGQVLDLKKGGDPHWNGNRSLPHPWPSDSSWSGELRGTSIYGDGRHGCHSGSGLSGIGGTIRKHTLPGNNKIQHALKINLDCLRVCSNTTNGFRWPAYTADRGATTPGRYGGTNPSLKMGSLLALPPSTDLSFIKSENARQIAEALRDYGAYVVDDTAEDRYGFSVERGAEFADNYQFYVDLIEVIKKLHVVDNNGPSSVGGGGSPRLPLAPCFSNGTECANTTPVPSPSPQPAPAPAPAPAPSPAPSGQLPSNNWSTWVYREAATGQTVTTPLSKSQTGRLLVQLDAYKRGYKGSQYGYYCLNRSVSQAQPKSITFTASYNAKTGNTLYFYTGSSENKIWQVNDTGGQTVTKTVTVPLSTPTNYCFGNVTKADLGSNLFASNRFVNVTSYKFNY